MPICVQSCTVSEEYSERFIDKCIEKGTILKAVRVANDTKMKKAYLKKNFTLLQHLLQKTTTNKQETVLLGMKLRTTDSQF